MNKNDEFRLILKVVLSLVTMLALIAFLLMLFCSCTLSFQNISTHGTAEDLVDENLKTDPTISPDISIPISGI